MTKTKTMDCLFRFNCWEL
jgi:C1A family cysteine protease